MALEEESSGKDKGSVRPFHCGKQEGANVAGKDLQQMWGLPHQGRGGRSKTHMGFIVHLPELDLLHGMLGMM